MWPTVTRCTRGVQPLWTGVRAVALALLLVGLEPYDGATGSLSIASTGWLRDGVEQLDALVAWTEQHVAVRP